MSGEGQALSAASRPSGVVMSPATVFTLTPSFRSSTAVASSASAPRAVMTRFTPSRASEVAHPFAQALRCCADQRGPAFDSKIHI
jgi:hypothetical protein